MERGKVYTWWHSFYYTSSESDSNGEMIYTCDANLGAPSSNDCSQLVYSGLGPPSDSVTISPGLGTKFLSFKTCNVGITAPTTVSLTWAQIQTALNTLIDHCVMQPFLGSQGGRAYAGTVPTSKVNKRRKGREKRSTSPLSGLNALPRGVTMILLKQDSTVSKDPAVELKSCTWMQALRESGNVNICPSGN